MGDESERLQDQHTSDMADDHEAELEEESYYKHLNEAVKLYNDGKRAEVKTTIRCAWCQKLIVKDSYQKVFCSNKGKGNCKDTYWNNVNDNRRDRAKRFNKKC